MHLRDFFGLIEHNYYNFVDQDMENMVELKIDRQLIDPKFEGYKLSLDAVPVHRKDLEKGLDLTKPSEEQYSYHHVKLFGSHNHLVADPWDLNSVYFIDKSWIVWHLRASMETALDNAVAVYEIPDAANKRLVPGRHNVSMHFTSSHLVALSDGTGHMYLLDTGNRLESNNKWKVLFSDKLLQDNQLYTLTDGVLTTDNETNRVHLLLTRVEETEAESKKKYRSPFITVIEWITLSSVDSKSWIHERARHLVGRAPFDCAALQQNGEGVIISSEQPYIMTYDSVTPVIDETSEAKKQDEKSPKYIWSQNEEEVVVQCVVPPSVGKADIYLTLKSSEIDFGIKNEQELLKGHLDNLVDVDGSTWTISDQRLELTLSKSQRCHWNTVVTGDDHGEMVVDGLDAEAIHNRLAHLTSDRLNPDPCPEVEKPYNAQELEYCDAFPNDNSVLQIIDGETHKVTHQVNIASNQWLFNLCIEPHKPPAICLRHDVDGILWELKEDITKGSCPWKHLATFNAFGYVQASKVQKRFSSCSPDFSYSVISDCVKHVYVYRQSLPVSSPLRNRKTGKQVMTVAKQQVIALESVDDIVGLRATNHRLFIATANTVYAAQINVNEI